ncbi:MAG: hypothetical protein Q4C70_04800 [Planctomycetia bacterium]|nr:hypothetical protein [Planctomycetia bacterium]
MNTDLITLLADRLRDETEIHRAKVFPYQLMTAYKNCSAEIPHAIREALQDAMEIATANVPKIPGRVAVCIDVSSSMGWSITGWRASATSTVRCIDVAALITSCILRKNPNTTVISFNHDSQKIILNPRDSVLTNAEKLAELLGGGTNCGAAMRYLAKQETTPDVVIFVSDNESWLGSNCGDTEAFRYWKRILTKNPSAKLINIDIQPYGTTQTPDCASIANVGGFSDVIFDFIHNFVTTPTAQHWVETIESITL